MKKIILGTVASIITASSIMAATVNIDGGLKFGTGQMIASSETTNATDSATQTFDVGLDIDFKLGKNLKMGFGFASHIPTTDSKDSIELGALNETHLKLGFIVDKDILLYVGGHYGIQNIDDGVDDLSYHGSGVSYGATFDFKRHSAFDVSYTNYTLSNEDKNMDVDLLTVSYVLKF